MRKKARNYTSRIFIDTVPFIPNAPPFDDFKFREKGGVFNAWGEKISFFLRFMIFWCNRQNFGPETGGGCLSRCNRNLRFWPKTGGCVSEGVFGMKGTVCNLLLNGLTDFASIKNIIRLYEFWTRLAVMECPLLFLCLWTKINSINYFDFAPSLTRPLLPSVPKLTQNKQFHPLSYCHHLCQNPQDDSSSALILKYPERVLSFELERF